MISRHDNLKFLSKRKLKCQGQLLTVVSAPMSMYDDSQTCSPMSIGKCVQIVTQFKKSHND